MMKILFWIAGAIMALVFVLWLGFKGQPRGFAELPYAGQKPALVPIPEGLPAPVERFLRVTYGGDRIPVLVYNAQFGDYIRARGE